MVEFDHFEIGVVDDFPCAEKLNGVTSPYPILDYIGRAAVSLFGGSHVGKGYVVLFFPSKNCYLRVLNGNLRHNIFLFFAFQPQRQPKSMRSYYFVRHTFNLIPSNSRGLERKADYAITHRAKTFRRILLEHVRR